MGHTIILGMSPGESKKDVDVAVVGGRSESSPPTTAGIIQAECLGRYLLVHDVTPDVIYTSPAARAVMSATVAFARRPDLLSSLVVDPELAGLYHGKIEGQRRLHDFKEVHERALHEVISPEGESAATVALRGLGALTRIGEDNPGKLVAVFGDTELFNCVTAGLSLRNGGSLDTTREIIARQAPYCSLAAFAYSERGGLEPLFFGHPTGDVARRPPVGLPQTVAY